MIIKDLKDVIINRFLEFKHIVVQTYEVHAYRPTNDTIYFNGIYLASTHFDKKC